MSSREISDEKLIQLVLEPESPEAALLLDGCDQDPALADRVLEVSSLRFLLRSVVSGSAHPGPTSEQVARFAARPDELPTSERASVRLHASVSPETQAEIRAVAAYLHRNRADSAAHAAPASGAPGVIPPLRTALPYAVVAASAVVFGVWIGSHLAPRTAITEVAFTSVRQEHRDAAGRGPCNVREPPRWNEMAATDVPTCVSLAPSGAKGTGGDGLVAMVATDALPQGTRLRISDPASGRQVIVTVEGYSAAGLSVSPEAWERLGLDEDEREAALLVRMAPRDRDED